MRSVILSSARLVVSATLLLGLCCFCGIAMAQDNYHPIHSTMGRMTVTLTGDALTVDEVLEVARYGAQVQLSARAKQRNLDTFNLMNEGAAEGVPIYLFNRDSGAGREIERFSGGPMSPANRPKLEAQALASFKKGGRSAASPGMLQGVIDLLNHDITPIMRSRSGTGEAEGPAAGAIDEALVGAGQVYYQGKRMSASDALSQAGLKPIRPAPGDSTMGSVNADVAGLAAILVADARRYLEWGDLIYAMDLDGMNSSLTPLFMPVQVSRPYPWINWQAARVLAMLRGSYLFNYDPAEQQDPRRRRIIQDPESLRASYVRQGSAWKAWAELRDDVTTQINGTEHNPVTRVNVSPNDSWELSTPWAMHYYVKGSTANGYKHGYVFSNANWDPYPLSNDLEAFTIALANMDVAVMLRQERFGSPFFTGVTAQSVLNPASPPAGAGSFFSDALDNHEAWQTIQRLMMPVPPEGYSADPEGVEELDAESLFKAKRAIRALEESWALLAGDLYTSAIWMDVREKQDPTRPFGAAPTAAWQAFRKIVPLTETDGFAGDYSDFDASAAAVHFMETTPASTFFSGGPAMPSSLTAGRGSVAETN